MIDFRCWQLWLGKENIRSLFWEELVKYVVAYMGYNDGGVVETDRCHRSVHVFYRNDSPETQQAPNASHTPPKAHNITKAPASANRNKPFPA